MAWNGEMDGAGGLKCVVKAGKRMSAFACVGIAGCKGLCAFTDGLFQSYCVYYCFSTGRRC